MMYLAYLHKLEVIAKGRRRIKINLALVNQLSVPSFLAAPVYELRDHPNMKIPHQLSFFLPSFSSSTKA
jgi:hypothetical protein